MGKSTHSDTPAEIQVPDTNTEIDPTPTPAPASPEAPGQPEAPNSDHPPVPTIRPDVDPIYPKNQVRH